MIDLREHLRRRVVAEVFNVYNDGWCNLVYDTPAAEIMHGIFTRSDFLGHNIMASNHIEEERDEMDFPVIYFVSANKKICNIINKENASNKYSKTYVCTLSEPDGLDSIIRGKVVNINVQVLEERVFKCKPEYLHNMSSILDSRIYISYTMSDIRAIAEQLSSKINNSNNNMNNSINSSSNNNTNNNISTSTVNSNSVTTSLLLVSRMNDVFTPLLHFFTFKSFIAELDEEVDHNDILFPKLRYKHMAEISSILQSEVKKLNRNVELLNNGNVDITQLSKMTLEAPRNMEMKEAINKYSVLLNTGLKRLEYLKNIVEAEQILATLCDRTGKKIKLSLDYFFELLGSTKFSMPEKRRLLYLIKARDIPFTNTERGILNNFGFSVADINTNISTTHHIRQDITVKYKYDISRYRPLMAYLVEVFNSKSRTMFKTIGPVNNTTVHAPASSLRCSAMISSNKDNNRPVILLYFVGGITIEECGLAYLLSEQLNIEVICGSDKIINAEEFIKDINEINKINK